MMFTDYMRQRNPDAYAELLVSAAFKMSISYRIDRYIRWIPWHIVTWADLLVWRLAFASELYRRTFHAGWSRAQCFNHATEVANRPDVTYPESDPTDAASEEYYELGEL